MSISHNNLSVGLDEINSVYEAQFTLIMSWYDKRLVFNNLNSLTEKNSLSKNEREKLWFPKVVFENTNDKLQTVMDDITTTNIKSFNITSFKFADKTEHEAVKYTCNICNYQATHMGSLKRHKNTERHTSKLKAYFTIKAE